MRVVVVVYGGSGCGDVWWWCLVGMVVVMCGAYGYGGENKEMGCGGGSEFVVMARVRL